MSGKREFCSFVRVYVISWDTVAGILGLLLAIFLVPEYLNTEFLQSLFSVGVGALSIIFAVYFAALTTVTSSGSDEFITFLDLHGHLTSILTAFRTTLLALFIALLYSLSMFAAMAFLSGTTETVARWPLLVFSPVASYSLVAACLMALDAIRYARERGRYYRLDAAARQEHIESLKQAAHADGQHVPERHQRDRDHGDD